MDTIVLIIKIKGKYVPHLNINVDFTEFRKDVNRLIQALQSNPTVDIPPVGYLTSDLVFTFGEDKTTSEVSAGNNLNKFILDIETHAFPESE